MPIQIPYVNQAGAVINPANVNFPQGSQVAVSLGNQGDQLASELHGKYYQAAVRGNAFRFSTVEAGVTIPVKTATAGVYMIRNPAGSGKVLEFIRAAVLFLAATEVVAAIGFGVQVDTSPTTYTTAGVITPLVQGGGSQSTATTVWTAVTQTAVADVGGNFKSLFSVPATASTNLTTAEYDFDGTFLLAPGQQVTMLSTVAQSSAAIIDVSWAEWPYPAN